MIRRCKNISASRGELGNAKLGLGNNIFTIARHGMRDINAAEETYLSTECILHSREIRRLKRLKRMDHVNTDKNNIRKYFCDRAIAVQHNLRIRIMLFYYFDQSFDTGFNEFAEHYRRH